MVIHVNYIKIMNRCTWNIVRSLGSVHTLLGLSSAYGSLNCYRTKRSARWTFLNSGTERVRKKCFVPSLVILAKWLSHLVIYFCFSINYPDKLYVPSFEQIWMFFTQVCFAEINLVVIEGSIYISSMYCRESIVIPSPIYRARIFIWMN